MCDTIKVRLGSNNTHSHTNDSNARKEFWQHFWRFFFSFQCHQCQEVHGIWRLTHSNRILHIKLIINCRINSKMLFHLNDLQIELKFDWNLIEIIRKCLVHPFWIRFRLAHYFNLNLINSILNFITKWILQFHFTVYTCF